MCFRVLNSVSQVYSVNNCSFFSIFLNLVEKLLVLKSHQLLSILIKKDISNEKMDYPSFILNSSLYFWLDCFAYIFLRLSATSKTNILKSNWRRFFWKGKSQERFVFLLTWGVFARALPIHLQMFSLKILFYFFNIRVGVFEFQIWVYRGKIKCSGVECSDKL